MNKFALTFAALFALGATVYAGDTYSGKDKEVIQQAPAVCDWYRAHEWDLDLWGTFAFPANTGRRTTDEGAGTIFGIPFTFRDTSSADRFIDRDDAWGGGADVKYFFSKYWALGAEGLVLDTNNNEGGAGFGTFTFRYPIGCSRFAPYGWVGGGVTSGGGHHDEFEVLAGGQPFIQENNFENKHAEATVQFGTGLECRITRRIGVMGDFAWNIVSGPDNNYGMTRFGLTLSY